MSTPARFIPVSAVAEKLSISRRQVLGMVAAGVLTGLRINARTVRVSEESLAEFVRRRLIK